MKYKNTKLGFTIIELLLVMAIILILSATTIGYYRGKIIEVSLESTTKIFVSDIKSAKIRAMSGDMGMDWGVRAISRDVSGMGSFELFTMPIKIGSGISEIINVNNLSSGLAWADPSVGKKEVIFKAITGETEGATFTIGYGDIKYKIDISSGGEVIQTRL